MSRKRRQNRATPRAKLNGRPAGIPARAPASADPPIDRSPSRAARPKPRARPGRALLITLAILVIALGGVAVSSSLGDSLRAAFQGPPGGNGQVVDGIPCQSREVVTYHVHAHLTILVDGSPITVPAQVGITGACLYWLHTHDTTGVIHVEAPAARDFTLGQFFDIWGKPLSASDVAGHQGPVTVYLDQQPYGGDPRAIPLRDHESIVLEVGRSVPPPPNYSF